jgi:cephalosporin hydroxylase
MSMMEYITQMIPGYAETITQAKWRRFTWKDLSLQKDPMSLATYQQFLQDIDPGTIIEFGTFEGGSALWFKDHSRAAIITIDSNDLQIKFRDPQIHYITLDANDIAEWVEDNRTWLDTLARPIVVIEDCHVNTMGILRAMDTILEADDWIIVEDTLGKEKRSIAQRWSMPNYTLSRHYLDFWGYNNSWIVDSWWRKTF